MNWNSWVRQSHRWVAAAFMATVIANPVAVALAKPPAWFVYVPLLPLALLFFTGLYLFALPYLARRRKARGTTLREARQS